MRIGRPPTEPSKRFFDKVNKTSTCWLWTGALFQNGYGQFRMPTYNAKAHRFSWELHFGKIQNNLFVLHKCDKPPCVNPNHLFLGTAKDNQADCIKKDRHSRGERNGNAKYSSLTIKKIREEWERSEKGKKEKLRLSGKFSINIRTLDKVIYRISWKHI